MIGASFPVDDGTASGYRVFLIGVLATLLLLAAIACASAPPVAPTATPAASPTARPTLTPVYATVAVKRGTLEEVVKLQGRVMAEREADLYFKDSGRLKSLAVEVGQEVQAGQLLAELDTGDLPHRAATAELDLRTAKLRLEKARSQTIDADLLRRQTMAGAALAMAQAQASYEKAKAGLAAAEAARDPLEAVEAAVANAQAGLEEAQREHVITQKSAIVSKYVRDRENEHSWYEARYGETLQKFQEGRASQADLDRDWSNLLTAKEKLDSARAEADNELAGARTRIAQAEEKLRKAQADWQELQAVPAENDVLAAQRALDTARLAWEKAQLDYAVKNATPSDEGAYDIQLLEQAVELARLDRDQAQAQLAEARLDAPFAGRVVGVRSRIGDQVSAYGPVVTIADPVRLQVCGELAAVDLLKVRQGQEVTVSLDGLVDQPLRGLVAGGNAIYSTRTSGGTVDREVRITVDWPIPGIQLGTPARMSILIRKQDNTLIVPAAAVKTIGQRRVVEYLDGGTRRAMDVEVGLISDTEVEVLSGLREGQEILAQ